MPKLKYENDFVVGPEIDPHRTRRKEILAKHPEIKKLMGYDPLQAISTVLVVLLLLALSYGVQLLSLSILKDYGKVSYVFMVITLAYGVGAILSHMLAMAIHEASHDLFFKTKLANKVIAVFANIPMIFPFALSFRRYHIDHHLYLGDIEDDKDLPLPIEKKMIENSTWKKFLWIFFNHLFYFYRSFMAAKIPNRDELLNLLFLLFTNFLIYHYLGLHAFVFLMLSFMFGLGFAFHPVAAHFIHEHYLFNDNQETYSYYGPLNYVTYNVGYHIEHHDFMNIPGSRLPQLNKMIPHYYNHFEGHKSWTWVLWHFVFDPKMGLASRMIRSSKH